MTWYWTALPMCVLSHYSHVQLFVTPWTVAHQAPLTMGFSRQEYWSGLPCPPPGDLPDPGIQPVSPEFAGGFFTTEPPEKPTASVTSEDNHHQASQRCWCSAH